MQKFTDSSHNNVAEILASYVTGYTIQSCYAKAVELFGAGKVDSITAGYRNVLMQFLVQLDNPTWLPKQLSSIAIEYGRYSYGDGSVESMANKWMAVLVPKDYHSSLQYPQKLKLLTDVYKKCTSIFVNQLLSEYFSRVIDNRKDPTLPITLKEYYKSLLVMERNILYERLAAAQTGNIMTKRDARSNEHKKLFAAVDALHKKCEALIKECSEKDKVIKEQHKKITTLAKLLKSSSTKKLESGLKTNKTALRTQAEPSSQTRAGTSVPVGTSVHEGLPVGTSVHEGLPVEPSSQTRVDKKTGKPVLRTHAEPSSQTRDGLPIDTEVSLNNIAQRMMTDDADKTVLATQIDMDKTVLATQEDAEGVDISAYFDGED